METPDLDGEIINLGCPEKRTVVQIAETSLALAGQPVRIEHRPLPGDDPTRCCPDVRKARGLLGWSPSTSLHHGLGLTMASFRAELGRMATGGSLMDHGMPAPVYLIG
jgi:nucleoside-diphosphate-sugar epimerase